MLHGHALARHKNNNLANLSCIVAIEYQHSSFFTADCLSNVQVESPAYDYIPPELVGLFVTNLGGHNPSYIYRLLVEFYNPEDTLDDQQ